MLHGPHGGLVQVNGRERADGQHLRAWGRVRAAELSEHLARLGPAELTDRIDGRPQERGRRGMGPRNRGELRAEWFDLPGTGGLCGRNPHRVVGIVEPLAERLEVTGWS